ncbi:MAG: PD40 domain-containing protein [Deltaproteobacteria bacterium]|nr:MAG: PD40 domain-containing protein [Deltaproteobacteria bacterium]
MRFAARHAFRRAALAPLLAAVTLSACGERSARPAAADSQALVLARRVGDTRDLVWVRLSDGAERGLRETPRRDEAWPYWSAGAGRIVFQVRPLDARRLYRLLLLDPVTRRETPLTRQPALHEHWPVWSPDGSRVVYSFSERDRRGIAAVEVASRRRTVLESTDHQDGFSRPEFAPDGRRLVAQRGAVAAATRLWILEPGRAARPLTAAADGLQEKGRFTRDGDWVVFTARPSRDAPGELWIVRPDGSDGRAVASDPDADDHTADPSPTRDELAFISDRDGSQDLFVADLSGGPARNLSRTPDREERAPHWSPDGERIVVTAFAGDAVAERRETRVVVMDRQGTVLLDVPGAMPDWMPAFE